MNSKVLESPARIVFALFLTLSATTTIGLTQAAAASPSVAAVDRARSNRVSKHPSFSFDLTVSAGAAACLPDARGEVTITPRGASQEMDVFVTGLPANTTFTVFVLQLPHAPFGLAWYQGDIETNAYGDGHTRTSPGFSATRRSSSRRDPAPLPFCMPPTPTPTR